MISRTSAMTFKGAKRSLPSIAQDLNVRYVLEGSVRRAGNNVRITAQLIDARHDAHLWAEKYAGTLDDVFDLQEQLSRRIVDALELTLTPDEDRRLAARPIPDACPGLLPQGVARDSFLYRGRPRASAPSGEPSLGDGRGERASRASAAPIHWQYHNAGIKVDEATLAVRSLLLPSAGAGPGAVSGRFSTGSVAWTRGDLQTAARHFRQAAELEVNGDALAFLSYVYALADRIPSASGWAVPVAVDPLNAWAQ